MLRRARRRGTARRRRGSADEPVDGGVAQPRVDVVRRGKGGVGAALGRAADDADLDEAAGAAPAADARAVLTRLVGRTRRRARPAAAAVARHPRWGAGAEREVGAGRTAGGASMTEPARRIGRARRTTDRVQLRGAAARTGGGAGPAMMVVMAARQARLRAEGV